MPGFDITFTIGERVAGGRAGCNGYGGRRRFSGDELSIGSIGQNTAGCGDAVNNVEMRYTTALGEITGFQVSDDRLMLEGPDTRLIFTEAPPIPIEAIVDATWHLRSVLLRRGEDVRTKRVEPATLKLSEDGTFIATTGCSRITGGWKVVGPNINAVDTTLKGRCPRSHDQSQYLYGTLGEFTVDVQADTLTLFGVGGYSTAGAIYSKE